MQPPAARAAIEALARHTSGQISYCHAKNLGVCPCLAGSLDLHATVEAGKLQQARVLSGTLRDVEPVTGCATGRLPNWDYPYGFSGTFTLAYRFSAELCEAPPAGRAVSPKTE